MTFPENLLYTKEHEWALVEGNTAKIGITEYAVNSLGDIVFVELPENDKELNTNDTFGVVESVKAVSDLYSPVSGKIIETNDAIVNDPSLVNSAPYTDGWMIKIEISDTEELKNLLDHDKYKEIAK